ncbi:MAG: hypothetical protein LBI72_13980 [Flavobacteriaceae bacterium]|jgi:YD repeat-containing protein|nr:hypothetical protein [Flavobacteriaceae bacterium]
MKNYSIFLLFNLSCLFLYGQGGDDAPLMFDNSILQKTYTIANPDMYNFEKHNISDINYYVGKANITIPLYTIEAGGIVYPLTLSYDTGGIKVDQYASNVGLGWSLNKTAITRTVHQDNDFAGLIRKSKVFGNKLMENEKAPALTKTDNAGYFLNQEGQASIFIDKDWPGIDFLPDIYNVYANDFKTNFFFKNINTPIESKAQESIIEAMVDVKRFYPFQHDSYNKKYAKYIYQWPTVDFFSFVIKRNNGLHYYFKDCDISSSFNNNYTPYYGQSISLPSPQVSSWNISKIIDTSTGNSIDFEYKTIEVSPGKSWDMFSDEFMQTARTTYTYSYSLDIPDQLESKMCMYNEKFVGTNDMWRDFDNRLVKQSSFDVERKRLKKIKFPEGVVEFYYNNEQVADGMYGEERRIDLWEGDFLTYMVVKDLGNNIIKSFVFKYDYFRSEETGREFQPYNTNAYLKGYRYNRLKLVSIQESNKPAYIFSYEENIKLPPINSFSVDFLGYFNNSKDVSNLNELYKKTPTIYYYPNQFEKSVLPFEVSGVFSQKVDGYFDREANDYAKAWTLKKIKYPEGGELVLNYELNDFTIFGDDKTVKGGGIRVKNQILYDGDNNIAEISNYSYNHEGKSSGKLFSIPFFGHPLKKFFDVNYNKNATGKNSWITQNNKASVTDLKFFKIQDKSNLNEDITSGAFIGYSKVVETKENIGKKEFHFTSSNKEEFSNQVYRNTELGQYTTVYPSGENYYLCIGEFLIMNSGISSAIFTDLGYKRGKLLKEINYNSAESKVKEVDYTYNSLFENQFMNYWQPINQPSKFIDSRGIIQLLQVNKKYIIDNYLLTDKETTYFEGSNKIIDKESFTYNSNSTLSEYSKNGDGKFYYYSGDIESKLDLAGNTSKQELDGYKRMRELNNINTPVQITDYISHEQEEVSKKRLVYKNIDVGPLGGIFPILNGTKSSFGEDAKFEDDYKVLLYDQSKTSLVVKPIVIQEKSGKNIGLVWGYNGTKVIAKIENIEDLSSVVFSSNNPLLIKAFEKSNVSYSEITEEELLQSLTALKEYLWKKNPNAFITTYTYKPLVGVSTITDANGIITYYKYDEANRLKQILDLDKNILEEYKYNFKNNFKNN